MGWHTDWLYQLIFAEVSRLWRLVTEQGATDLFGPPPGHLVIREHAKADWTEPYCVGTVLRAWRYNGAAFEACAPTTVELHVSQAQKAFYPYGVIQFHIRSDRKTVAFTYVLGPRYGRGIVFRVCGQGRQSRLEPDPDAPGWIS